MLAMLSFCRGDGELLLQPSRYNETIISPPYLHMFVVPNCPHRRGVRSIAGMVALLALSACGTVKQASGDLVSVIQPYKMDVVQGNFVSREQAAALRTGMTRQQVRNILGSALLTSVFHADRWDYVFSLRRQGQADQPRRVTVFFKGEALDRVDADDLPSEAEFVATLSPRKQAPAVPVLEATEEQLSKYPAPAPKAAPALPPPLPDSYPPLEPVSR